jgi:hypothetical protein
MHIYNHFGAQKIDKMLDLNLKFRSELYVDYLSKMILSIKSLNYKVVYLDKRYIFYINLPLSEFI